MLDLPAAGAELEHAASVQADPSIGAIVVEVEQRPKEAETRRLGVQRAGREGEVFDVGDGVDRSVPGDPVAVRPEDRVGLVGHGRIFEPDLGKALGDAAVELEVRRSRARIRVVSLVVDDVDRSGRRELVHELVRPGGLGVELEAQLWIELQTSAQRLGRGRVAETGRDDEGHRLRRPAEGVAERQPRLPQRQVERRALVGPALVRLFDRERRGERLQRPRTNQWTACAGGLLAVVSLCVPRDVLA